jgi:pimeloyl-ACP methyl ester carboxylesterase
MKKKSLQTPIGLISYFERLGGCKPVVFVHGNSSSCETFRETFRKLPEDCGPLYALDLPGHGDSQGSGTTGRSYTLLTHAEAIAAFTQELDLHDVLFVGHSLGAHILLEGVSLLKKRARSFYLYGFSPITNPPNFEEAFGTDPIMGSLFKSDLTPEEEQAWVKKFAPHANDKTACMLEDLRRTDPQARAQLGASIGELKYKDEAQILKEIGKPVTCAVGEEDTVVNIYYLKKASIPTQSKEGVQVFRGCGHYPHLEDVEAFAQAVARAARD